VPRTGATKVALRKTKKGLIEAVFFESISDGGVPNSYATPYATHTFTTTDSLCPTQGVFMREATFSPFVVSFARTVLGVLLVCNPLKVLYQVVSSITIFVVNLGFVFRVGYKSLCDHTVNIGKNSAPFTPTAVDSGVSVIAAVPCGRKKYTSWPNYIAKGANFISRVFGPLAPFFGVHDMVYKPKIERAQGVN